jgi:hypothetical protein
MTPISPSHIPLLCFGRSAEGALRGACDGGKVVVDKDGMAEYIRVLGTEPRRCP